MSRSDAANRAAVDWLLRLEAQLPGSAQHQAFDAWHSAHPEHARAWQRVENLLSTPLSLLQEADRRHPGQLQAASQSLRALPSASRRKVLGGGLAMLLGLGSASVINRMTPLGELFADQHTATGERRTLALADGSRLSLGARTAVDIAFDAGQRRIVLRQGAVQVDAAFDPQRPFIVDCHEGRVQATQAARFVLRRDEQGCLAAAQQHSLMLNNLGGQHQRIDPGQAFAFSTHSITPQAPSWRSRADWVDGHIDVRDEPLAQLVEALRPYRSGFLRISPAAARLRVYGVFPLDDSERALQSLAETLPVQVVNHAGWLTLIDLRAGKNT